MAETLLSGTAILMYGRVMNDLTLTQDEQPALPLGALHHLQEQLAAGARLARIYAFSYGGDFYTLTSPTIFLVHSAGAPAFGNRAGVAARLPISPGDADETGVGAQDYQFSDDMMVWSYEKNDISLRLDLSTGTLQDILLEAELGDDMDFPSFGGGKVGGGKVGGGKVGGGKVGGGKVGGGKVGGGKVGGGKVGGG